ncbi:MAG: ribosome small subunit-dependent GTPase A [Pseudomonadota bacterium]
MRPTPHTDWPMVVEVHGELVSVEEPSGDIRRCAVSPDAPFFPVIGDRVVVDEDGPRGRPVVVDAAPRQNRLARLRHDRTRRSDAGAEEHVLAANIDLAVIVVAAKRPPFHPRLIDRYLVLCQYGGIDAAVAVNKADLTDDLPDLSIYRDLGLPIVEVSAKTHRGLDELRRLIDGKLVVFAGHSGVGKSSLVNALVGEAAAETAEVGGKRGQGRHTTSVATLHWLDDETGVVDTPGVRSLAMTGISPQELAGYFPEFLDLIPACRFRDCTHDHEPGCAVREAAEAGEIPPARYDSYLRLLRDD